LIEAIADLHASTVPQAVPEEQQYRQSVDVRRGSDNSLPHKESGDAMLEKTIPLGVDSFIRSFRYERKVRKSSFGYAT
jgi:hypothetical protein